MVYPVDESYQLWVTSARPDIELQSVKLKNTLTDAWIEIREKSVDQFLEEIYIEDLVETTLIIPERFYGSFKIKTLDISERIKIEESKNKRFFANSIQCIN